LFEIGRHYRLNGSESIETRVLTIGATGEAREKGLYDTARDFSFADLKGDVDSIGELCGRFRWEDGGAEWLHAARRASVGLNTNSSTEAESNSSFGVAGQLARRVAEKLKLRQEVFLAELRLDPVYAAMHAAKEARRYEPLPRFPSVERDFSLLLADGTKFADVTKTIQSLGIGEIHSTEATDLFRGKNVPAGKYSLLVRVTFQSREATLTDAQINDYSGKIIAALEKNLGAQLRAS
jgi:phenylalanyl-tRNA synthetase beta chain